MVQGDLFSFHPVTSGMAQFGGTVSYSTIGYLIRHGEVLSHFIFEIPCGLVWSGTIITPRTAMPCLAYSGGLLQFAFPSSDVLSGLAGFGRNPSRFNIGYGVVWPV